MNSEELIKSGTPCTHCKKGRIALTGAKVGHAMLDDEPYTNGIKEGDNSIVWFKDFIVLSILACDYCGYVYSSNIEK